MKAIVLYDNFSKAISLTSRFSGGKVQLPVLANILLQARGNKIILSATNLETSIVCPVGAKITTEGEITIPARIISEIIGSLSVEQINLASKGESLEISTDKFSTEILGMNSSDFPSIPSKLGKNRIEIDEKGLAKSLSKTIFSASTDETRPVLTGVLMIVKSTSITFVSTDGFRLSQYEIKGVKNDIGQEKELRLIVPKNTFIEISRLIGSNSKVEFSFESKENQMVVQVNDVVVSSRIIQGEFPDFERIIPKETSITVSVDKEELLKAVKLSSVFARDAGNVVKLEIGNDEIRLRSESSQSGSQKTSVDAKVEGLKGKGFVIAYNFKFIEDFVNSVKGENIEMRFSDSNAPGMFLEVGEDNYLHIIMPVKISN